MGGAPIHRVLHSADNLQDDGPRDTDSCCPNNQSQEWRGRIHLAMQEDGVPLLRLGGQLKRHEWLHQRHPPQVCCCEPPDRILHFPRPNKHPVVTGHYINGRTKPVCVRNLSPYEILEKVELLRDASGEKLTKTNKAVTSTKDSVRGIWSPFHGKGEPV